MSEDDIGLEIEEDSGNETSPEKSERKESRELIEEPGDDDGENRHPTEHNSMLYTALIVVKGMIGAGILNLPLIIKTFGFIGGSILTFFLAFIAITVAYYLGRDKDIKFMEYGDSSFFSLKTKEDLSKKKFRCVKAIDKSKVPKNDNKHRLVVSKGSWWMLIVLAVLMLLLLFIQ